MTPASRATERAGGVDFRTPEPRVNRRRHRRSRSLPHTLKAIDTASDTTWEPTAPRPTRVLAALAPQMLATARDQADGAHPYLTLPEHTAMAREVLGPDKLLAPEVSCVLTDDVDVWRQRAHNHLELYTGLPNYVGNWLRMGFTNDDTVRGGSDRLKSTLACRGIEATMQPVKEQHATGADHVCIQVLMR